MSDKCLGEAEFLNDGFHNILWQNGHTILDIAKGLNCTGAEGILSKYYKAETVRA